MLSGTQLISDKKWLVFIWNRMTSQKDDGKQTLDLFSFVLFIAVDGIEKRKE